MKKKGKHQKCVLYCKQKKKKQTDTDIDNEKNTNDKRKE